MNKFSKWASRQQIENYFRQIVLGVDQKNKKQYLYNLNFLIFERDKKMKKYIFTTTIFTFLLYLFTINANAQKSELIWTGTHDRPVKSVGFSVDGSKVVSGGDDGNVKVWDGYTGKLLWTGNHDDAVTSVEISVDCSMVVSGSDDKTVKVWNGTNGELLWTGNHSSFVNSVGFSEDESRVVSGSHDETVKVWDGNTGKLLWTGNHGGIVYSVGISDDGRNIVSGGWFTVKVWNGNNGELLWTGEHDDSFVRSVVISDDSRMVVSGSEFTVKVWDGNNGELLWTGKQGRVFDVGINKDRSKVVSVGDDAYLKVWDGNTGKLLWTRKHDSPVYSVGISDDGSKVVSGSGEYDYTVKVWDGNSGELLWTGKHESTVNSVVISDDGRKVVSGSSDYTVKVWDLDYLNTNKIKKELSKLHHDLFAKKGEYETEQKYYARLVEQNNMVREKNKKNKIEEDIKIQNSLKKIDLEIQKIGLYKPDLEIFSITINGKTEDVKIPRGDAKTFKENYKKSKVTGYKQLKRNLKDYEYFSIIIEHPLTKSIYIFGDQRE